MRPDSTETRALLKAVYGDQQLPKPLKTLKQTVLGADQSRNLTVLNSVESILDQVKPSSELYRQYVQFVQDTGTKNILLLAGIGKVKI